MERDSETSWRNISCQGHLFSWNGKDFQNSKMKMRNISRKFLRNINVRFIFSVMFLEMTHSVPTGLGLPLKLQLSGSTVGTVDMEGKFDIRNMFWGKGSLNVNGFVKSSAVVEIAGKFKEKVETDRKYFYISAGPLLLIFRQDLLSVYSWEDFSSL